MLDVTLDLRELLAVAKTLKQAASGHLLQALQPSVFKQLTTTLNEIQANLSGPVLNVRTGTLRSSAQVQRPVIDGQTLVGRVGILRAGPAQKYAGFLLTGGTIRPRNSKFLAIPVGPALTARGVPRYKSPRDVPGLFFLPRPGGNGILAKAKGRGRNRGITPYFALRRSVTLPARDYLSGPRQKLIDNVQRAIAQLAAGAILRKT